MKKIGRIIVITICLCLFACCSDQLFPQAKAASAMTASDACIEFIKTAEGFSLHPYYDYSQHTVGYGTKCPTDKYFHYMVNGISRSEAEALLQEVLADVGNTINQKFIDKYNLILTQYQFDALVSFSFNIGTSWMTYDSTLRHAILNGGNAADLVYAFGLYCTAGGKYSSGLITRRLCEANMYLNGVYSQKPNEAYGYVFYEPNGGSLTYRVQGFVCDYNTAPAATATRHGDVFLGWYTDLTGGSLVSSLSRAVSGKTLFARWQSSENPDNQTTDSTMIKVTGDVVNIRKGPGTNYGIATQVYRNDVLIVTHVSHLTSMKWGKVQDGWISLAYTNYDAVTNENSNTIPESTEPSVDTPIPDSGPSPNEPVPNIPQENQTIITGTVRVNDLLTIRSGPGTHYPKVGSLFNGQKLEILEQSTAGNTNWGRITRGWVCMDYVVTDTFRQEESTIPESVPETQPPPMPQPEPPANTPEPIGIKGKITADALRIRSGAGVTNAILGFYYQNEVVFVSERVSLGSVYWGKTDRGWINMDYVQITSSEEAPTQNPGLGVKTVIADCLRVRKEIGVNQRIAALLYYGDTVVVSETRTVDGTVWGKVDKGWICMDYVR